MQEVMFAIRELHRKLDGLSDSEAQGRIPEFSDLVSGLAKHQFAVDWEFSRKRCGHRRPSHYGNNWLKKEFYAIPILWVLDELGEPRHVEIIKYFLYQRIGARFLDPETNQTRADRSVERWWDTAQDCRGWLVDWGYIVDNKQKRESWKISDKGQVTLNDWRKDRHILSASNEELEDFGRKLMPYDKRDR